MASTSSPRVDKSNNEAVGHQDALKPGQIEGWKKELHENYHAFTGTFDQYLDIFVPSSAPETIPSLPIDKAFSTFTPKKGKETRSYGGLVRSSLIGWHIIVVLISFTAQRPSTNSGQVSLLQEGHILP